MYEPYACNFLAREIEGPAEKVAMDYLLHMRLGAWALLLAHLFQHCCQLPSFGGFFPAGIIERSIMHRYHQLAIIFSHPLHIYYGT